MASRKEGTPLGSGGIDTNSEMALSPGWFFFQDWKNNMKIHAFNFDASRFITIASHMEYALKTNWGLSSCTENVGPSTSLFEVIVSNTRHLVHPYFDVDIKKRFPASLDSDTKVMRGPLISD